MDDDKTEHALAKNVVTEVSGAVAGLFLGPFSGPTVKGAAALWSEIHRRRVARGVDDFCKRAAEQIGAADPAAFVEELMADFDKEWLQEALVAGFWQMMSCLDEAAKPCVIAVFVDYRERQSNPDVFFRRVGNMFSECDKETLKTMKVVAKQYVDAVGDEPHPEGTRHLIRSTRRPDHPPMIWVTSPQVDGSPRRSHEVTEPENLSRVAQFLPNHGFGETPSGMGSTHFGGDCVLTFRPSSDSGMQALSTYLAPVT